MATVVADAIGAVGAKHPLEPLSVEEIAAAVDILRSQRALGLASASPQSRCTKRQSDRPGL